MRRLLKKETIPNCCELKFVFGVVKVRILTGATRIFMEVREVLETSMELEC